MQASKPAFLVSAVLAFVALLLGAADASQWVPMDIRPVVTKAAPVEFTDGMAYHSDDNDEIMACVGFTNRSAQEVDAVKVRFFEMDSYFDPVWSGDLSIDGTFSPNVPIQVKRALNGMPNDPTRCWTSSLGVRDARSIIVRVEKVLFADGTIWTNPLIGSNKPLAL